MMMTRPWMNSCPHQLTIDPRTPETRTLTPIPGNIFEIEVDGEGIEDAVGAVEVDTEAFGRWSKTCDKNWINSVVYSSRLHFPQNHASEKETKALSRQRQKKSYWDKMCQDQGRTPFRFTRLRHTDKFPRTDPEEKFAVLSFSSWTIKTLYGFPIQRQYKVFHQMAPKLRQILHIVSHPYPFQSHLPSWLSHRHLFNDLIWNALLILIIFGVELDIFEWGEVNTVVEVPTKDEDNMTQMSKSLRKVEIIKRKGFSIVEDSSRNRMTWIYNKVFPLWCSNKW